MFEDSLVESSGALSKRNPWTVAFSFLMQVLLAGVLLLIPLIYTQALPWRQLTGILTEPAPPVGSPPPARMHVRGVQSRPAPVDNILRPPTSIPRSIAMLHDEPENAEEAQRPVGSGVLWE